MTRRKKQIQTGTKYIIDPNGTPAFGRDIDRLYIQYANLRNKLYHKYKYNFKDYASREDLKSYIDEQFITLVKEYDINSPVDFPGYIKKKLGARVSQSFVRGNQRDREREFTTTKEDAIYDMILESDMSEEEDETKKLITEVFSGVELTEQQEAIINYMYEGYNDFEIIDFVAERFKSPKETVREDMAEIRLYVDFWLEEERGNRG